MADELPDMPDRPLLDTYVQRFMRIGGRVIVVTVIVGMIGGYVGARAFDRAGQNRQAVNPQPSPAPQPTVTPEPQPEPAPEPAPAPEPEPAPAPAPEPAPAPAPISYDGRYAGSGGDMNNGQGSFSDVVIKIVGRRLNGTGKLTGQTGTGPVEFNGTVSDDGQVEGTITGSLPSGGSGPPLALKGRINGALDGAQLNLEWTAKCDYIDLFGTLPVLSR
jgi:hypothetical protein